MRLLEFRDALLSRAEILLPSDMFDGQPSGAEHEVLCFWVIVIHDGCLGDC